MAMSKEERRAANYPIGEGRKEGTTALSNPAIKAIRLQEIVTLRAKGVPVPEIATLFRTTPRSIHRLLRWGNDQGLLGELREQALRKLGQPVLDAYHAALTAPLTTTPNEVEVHKMKLTAAKDVALGVGILQKKTEVHKTEDHMSMNWFLQEKYGRESAGETEGVVRPESVLDGTILGSEEGAETDGESDGEAGFSEWSDGGDSPLADPGDSE
jgi:hypothetical protein